MSATVLWVFQRPDRSEGVKTALERAGFAVRMADENLAALETFQRARPDVVVIEVPFPDTERLELCQVLKATPQGIDTPVLVVTCADDGMAYRAQAIHQYDADEFVYPFEPTRIAAACKRWLERAKAKPRTTPAPHQAALEEALDKLDTLLDEDLLAPAAHAASPATVDRSSERIPPAGDPLRESLDELTRMSDELVDRLPIQARADTVEQTPPSTSPKDIARLQQTLEELERLVEEEDDVATSTEVQVAGDRGDDIQAHLDTMFEQSEQQADAPARPFAAVVETPVGEERQLVEVASEEDGDELVTIESEDIAEPFDASTRLGSPRIPAPDSTILDEIERELHQHEDDEAEAALAAVEIEAPRATPPRSTPSAQPARSAQSAPWSPSAMDPGLTALGARSVAPRRRSSGKWWAAAAVVALAAGAGILWTTRSGNGAAEVTTVAQARKEAPGAALENSPGESKIRNAAARENASGEPTVDPQRARLTDYPIPVEHGEPGDMADAAEPGATTAPPPSKSRTAAREPAARPEPVRGARDRDPAPKPRAAERKPVVPATGAEIPKPPAQPPRTEPARLPSGQTPPSGQSSQVRSEVVQAAPATAVAGLKAADPNPKLDSANSSPRFESATADQKEVREAPPFIGTEKTGADQEEGRPSYVFEPRVEPPAPPPQQSLIAMAPAPLPPEAEPRAIAPSAAAPQPAPEAVKPAPREPVYEPPRLTNRAEAAYPPRARKGGHGGTVVLDVLVDESGTPVRVVVKEGVGNADIEAAAIHAVLRSSYAPARQDGAAVRGWTTERYVFKP